MFCKAQGRHLLRSEKRSILKMWDVGAWSGRCVGGGQLPVAYR